MYISRIRIMAILQSDLAASKEEKKRGGEYG